MSYERLEHELAGVATQVGMLADRIERSIGRREITNLDTRVSDVEGQVEQLFDIIEAQQRLINQLSGYVEQIITS